MPSTRVTLAIAATLMLAIPAPTEGHEIPKSVAIIAFVKPEGRTLRIVARVPLESMRDIEWKLRGPGYLELAGIDEKLRDGLKIWVIDNLKVFEAEALLAAPSVVAARVSLQSDRAYENFEKAVANATGPPLPFTTDIAWQQAMIDVVLDYPITNDRARFSIDPELARLGVRTTTVLRFISPDRGEHIFQYIGDPGLVHLDPSWVQAAGRFVNEGFRHILDGIDHLLFVLALVIPFRRLGPLLVIVTAFTVAHSITLIASATGLAPNALWFPPLVEVLIAASIVYTSFENIVGAKLERRWLVAFGFGLVHGFGFSFALRDSLQFAGSHLATSLLTFNIGVELGQVFVLLLTVPLLNWALKRVVAERMGTIILSALVAHTAWHWMVDRGAALREYEFTLPPVDAAWWAAAIRWVMLAIVIAAGAWTMRRLYARLQSGGAEVRLSEGGSSPSGATSRQQ